MISMQTCMYQALNFLWEIPERIRWSTVITIVTEHTSVLSIISIKCPYIIHSHAFNGSMHSKMRSVNPYQVKRRKDCSVLQYYPHMSCHSLEGSGVHASCGRMSACNDYQSQTISNTISNTNKSKCS